MRKENLKMVQKYCDVSNFSRMRKPEGKENCLAGHQLAEDILKLILQQEGGIDDTAKVLTALALLRSYFKKAIDWNYFMLNAEDLISRYENLFNGDAWMGMHEDLVGMEVSDFVAGKPRWRKVIGKRRKK